MSNNLGAEWKPGDPIGYIREEIPGFDVPAYVVTVNFHQIHKRRCYHICFKKHLKPFFCIRP